MRSRIDCSRVHRLLSRCHAQLGRRHGKGPPAHGDAKYSKSCAPRATQSFPTACSIAPTASPSFRLTKVAFFAGGRAGKGVMVVRDKDGRFTSPIFMTLDGRQLRLAMGRAVDGIVLVFTTARASKASPAASLTLGADASVAAGPVGRRHPPRRNQPSRPRSTRTRGPAACSPAWRSMARRSGSTTMPNDLLLRKAKRYASDIIAGKCTAMTSPRATS